MALWNKLGINFGYTPSYSYKGSVSADLDYLYSLGFRKIRIMGNVNDASMAFARSTAILAKQKGFYVIYGCSANGVTLTSSNFSTYQTQVLAEATIAETNGFDEFCEGNEEELRIDGSTIVDPYALYNTYMKPLSVAIRAVYSGVISFSISNGAESWIYGISMPQVARVGFNIYGDLVGTICTRSSFQSRITNFLADEEWGSKMYVSEWNTNYNGTYWTAESLKPETMTLEISNRQAFLRDTADIDSYYFCWSNNQGNEFSIVRSNGVIGDWFNPLSTNNKRHWFVNI